MSETIMDRFSRAYQSIKDKPAPSKPQMGEIALAEGSGLMDSKWFSPYNPSELVTRKGLKIFDKMRLDDQIKAAITFKKHAVLVTGWEIISPASQPKDWEVTEFVKWNLEQYFEDTLEEALLGLLTCLDYGYSVSELIWDTTEQGDFAGKAVLKAIKNRKPHDFGFKTDKYGNLENDGLIQYQSMKEERLPIDKFIIFSYEKEFGNYYGKSDLEAAYRPWWIKDNAYKWLSMLLERLGIPPIFALYDANSYNSQQLSALKDIITNLQAATGGIIPRGKDSNTLEFWTPELAKQATEVFIPALERFDKDIARAVLMPGLLGMTSDSTEGSFARSKVHFDAFLIVVDYLRKRIEGRVMQEQVVKPLVDYNYNVEDYPQFRFFPLTEETRIDLLDKYILAVEK